MRDYVHHLSAQTEGQQTLTQMHKHGDKHTSTAGPNATSPSSQTRGTCSSLGKVTHSSSKSLPESPTHSITYTERILYARLSSSALRSRAV